MPFESVGSLWQWAAFLVFILAMLALDLGVFNRRAHVISIREAAVWSVAWFALAAGFNLIVYRWFGYERALEFTAGYLLEKALSVDNLFVFLVVFSTFRVPREYQHRVLYWGVLGALVMRAIFIFAGGAFIQHFHWAVYAFGALLLLTGAKLLFHKDEAYHPESSLIVRAFRRLIPMTSDFRGSHFSAIENGRRIATPLLMTLVCVEVTDLLFAVDSIPAIFAVTTDPFIVFTSNIFAILGLRSLFFLLAGAMDKFAYLKVGLAFVLIFVGAKMLIASVYKVTILASLATIAIILTASIVASIVISNRRATRIATGQEPPPAKGPELPRMGA